MRYIRSIWLDKWYSLDFERCLVGFLMLAPSEPPSSYLFLAFCPGRLTLDQVHWLIDLLLSLANGQWGQESGRERVSLTYCLVPHPQHIHLRWPWTLTTCSCVLQAGESLLLSQSWGLLSPFLEGGKALLLPFPNTHFSINNM